MSSVTHILALATHLRLEIVQGVVLSGHPDFRDLHQHNEFSEKRSVTIPECCVEEGAGQVLMQAAGELSSSVMHPLVAARHTLAALSG